MRRMPIVTGACLGCAILFVASRWPAHGADKGDKKVPSKMYELMVKAHKGDKSPLWGLGKELKAEASDWAQVGKHVKVLTDLAEVLRASHPSSSGRYHLSASALDRAARGKDRKAAAAALVGLRSSCYACHYKAREFDRR